MNAVEQQAWDRPGHQSAADAVRALGRYAQERDFEACIPWRLREALRDKLTQNEVFMLHLTIREVGWRMLRVGRKAGEEDAASTTRREAELAADALYKRVVDRIVDRLSDADPGDY